MNDGWGRTAIALPEGHWTNRLTGGTYNGGSIALEEVLRDFPVALLVRDS
jgi:(1->4)-alpha-D-glucan 1-alpha-D-glucosylmutase